MHQLESQYLTTLDVLLGDILTTKETTGRNGAEVLRLTVPPSLHWLCGESDGFPLLVSKRVHWPAVVAEFCWMVGGHTDLARLDAWGAGHIWRPWALADGTIGKAYGYQIDHPAIGHQIADAIAELLRDPSSRRACWTHWRGDDIAHMALPPCHGCFCQLRIAGGKVHLHMHQRSADWCVGVPFNIAFYALLLKVCSRWLERPQGGLHISFGDAHMYTAHGEGAKEQRSRRGAAGEIIPPNIALIRPTLGGVAEWLRTMEPGDFRLTDYGPMPGIRFDVAI